MTAVPWIEAERARCRRPITPEEVPGLEALGAELRRLRRTAARVARPRLAVHAQVSIRQIEQIERAIRRTRRSTLNRIAAALVELQPDLGHADDLAAHLASLAGTGLAPESRYAARVEKRRKARWKRVERHVLYRYLVPLWHAQLDAELREERRAARESARLMRG